MSLPLSAQDNTETILQHDKETVIITIKVIEQKYINGIYSQAYKDLYNLCSENKYTKQFLVSATNILSQYYELEKNVMSCNIELSQLEVKKQQINMAFLILLRRMKQYLNNLQELTYESEVICMKEQRNLLRRSLMRVEEELADCSNQDKSEILKEVSALMKQMMPVFFRLMKLFRSL